MEKDERRQSSTLPADAGLSLSLNEELARIIRTARRLFNVRIAQVNLTDPSVHTINPDQNSDVTSLCAALQDGRNRQGLHEVLDLTLHAEVAAHSLVTGVDGIRYYAAVPLLTDAGSVLGTLCLLDSTPRTPMTADQQSALHDLAGMLLNAFNQQRVHADRALTLHKLAFQDLLTRLPNRRAFEEAFEYAVTSEVPFGLVLLDLDELKQVNDSQGHAQGDELLSSFARALEREFGDEASIYRWGGDEFVILYPGDHHHVQHVRNRVNRVEQQMALAGHASAHASSGVAEFPLDAQAPNNLLRLADQRMLREKAARRAARGLGGVSPDGQATPWSGEMLWQALKATSALISADGLLDQAGWQAFLEAAVAALPGSEAGTLYVLEETTFVLQAQVGYSDALLGAGRSPATMRRWHGNAEDWQGGVARVLRGSTSILARSYEYERPPDSASVTMDELCAVQQLQANLLIPVVVRGRVVAALNMDNLRCEQAFTPYEVRMAQEFGQQAAAILAAHERHAREAARTQELEVLAHANAALSTVQTPEDIERILVAETRALLRTEHAVFARYEPEANALRLVSPSGMYAGFSPALVPRGEGVAWQAIHAQEVLHVPSLLEDERIYRGGALVDGALIVAPLSQAAAPPVGALAAVRAAPWTFSDLDSRLLGALASAGVTAFDRLQATAQERQRSQELQMLAQLSAHVGLGDDCRSVAQACLTAARTFLNADFAVFVCPNRVSTVTQGCLPTVVGGVPAQDLEAYFYQLGTNNLDAPYCATHEYPMTLTADKVLVRAGLQALVQVPVLERGQQVGLVALTWFRPLTKLPASAAPLMIRSAELIGQVLDREAHIANLKDTREGALLTLGMSLELRDFETAGHTERVVSLALRIAQRLGIEEAALANLRVGAYLHDVGKLAIPDAILLKPGKLNADEWKVMQRHSTIGDELVARIPTVTPQARSVVRHHHERWDGTGYPDHLCGLDIPEGARIFSVADVYDALTSQRPYKAAWTHQQALTELRSQAGRQFDPEVVRAAIAELTSPSILPVLT